ncbi:MbeD/MobD family mobilization/exclusion protein [Escherichia coli]|uniref:MbeD/MobD family mobilization/exclusion protein n=1 Tax=Escherichia coli TaxID=562 RepID=UPI003EE0FBFA
MRLRNERDLAKRQNTATKTTRQENGQLREQCDDLSQQVQRLVEQVDHLSRLFITNSR